MQRQCRFAMFADRFFRRSLRDIDTLFDRMFEAPFIMPRVPTFKELGRSPSVDVRETDMQFIIEAELPGVRKDDIKVQCFENRTISIDGSYARKFPSSKKPEEDKNDEDSSAAVSDADTTTTDVIKEKDTPSHSILQSERAEGRFFRSFTLPEEIDCSKLDVTYENGLLSIIAPKTERKQGIPVTIKVK